MNFKKSWKRANEGFTLVELIVVIAILAILAGVAVPAYSGYIKKANKAADYQVLAAVNTAFAAAALENGDDVNELTSATAKMPLTGSEGAMTVNVSGIQPAEYQEAFERYFAGNTASSFKVITSLTFANGAFGENESQQYSYAGGYVTLNSGAIAALQGSTFLNAESLGGSAGLLDQVNTVTGIAAGMAGNLNAVFTDPTFTQSAMASLGVTTQEEYTAKQDEMIASIMGNNPGMSRDQAIAQLSANSAVLYAANSATNFSEEQVRELFSTTGIDSIKDNLKGGNTTDGMAQAALVYGMYTAYANSNEYGNSELQANTNDPLAVLNALQNDTNFKTYVNSQQGQTDLDAYLGALGMITDTAQSDPTAVEHLMVNGFNNAELKDLIASATGK